MKKKKLSVAILAAAVGITGTTVSGVSHAQSVALEEVVVTARKREEFLQEVPVAITAVSGEVMEQSGVFKFEDITKVTPGFTTTASPSNETALALTLRGQVQNDVLITLDPSVGVYLDGLYIARAYGLNADLLDLQTVQLLKGPQGTLFGRNSTGGAMLLQTNDPQLEEFNISGSLTGGGDLTGYKAVVNVPIGETMAFRVAHQSQERDDYIRNVSTGSSLGGFETETTRAKFRIAPTDTLDVVLTYDKFGYDSSRMPRNIVWAGVNPINGNGRAAAAGSGAWVGVFDENDDKVANTFDASSWSDTETYYGVVNWDSPIGEVKLTAGHREVKTQVHFDLDGAPAATHGSHGRGEMEQDSIEVQLTNSLFNDRLELVVGAMYFEESATSADYTSGSNGPNAVIPGIGPFSAVYYGEQEVESLGLYTQGTFELTDNSHLTLGLRYSKDEKELLQKAGLSSAGPYDSTKAMGSMITIDGTPILGSQCLNDGVIATGCARNLDTDDDAISWTIGYDYTFTPGIMGYVKASEGYRSGGFNIRTAGGVERPFKPEFTLEYEIGVKADLFDNRVRWNTAIYHSTTDDKQVSSIISAAGGQATTVVVNAAETIVDGIETELAVQLTESLTLQATYAYTDADYDSYKDESGNEVYPTPRMWYVPMHEYSVGLNWTQDFAIGNLSFNALYHWIDEMNSTDEAAFPAGVPAPSDFIKASKTDDYGTLNLRLTWVSPDERFNVSVWGNNVLDERARTQSLVLLASDYNYVSAQYNDPAIYGVTVGAKF
jgi:iron complex outermembrane receptor protein